MATKKTSESPAITDTVVVALPTPGADGCFSANPYKVDKLVIYFVERNVTEGSDRVFQHAVGNPDAEEKASRSEAAACLNPTAANVETAAKLRRAANAYVQTSKFYYSDAKVVAVVGSDAFPAWLSTDTPNALIRNVPADAAGNAAFGRFEYDWRPLGMREGDYFACWTWTPRPAGDKMSSYAYFALQGATQVTTSIPTHFTRPNKYDVLFDRYLPDMFRQYMTDDDLTPEIIVRYHKALARQFTDLENLANQIPDLMDANSTHEAFLPLLANMFGWKLKSDDSTLWRRQIKRAVPMYKKKGTEGGLKEALASAGMDLKKITRLWQVSSSYHWEESFAAAAAQTQFKLARVVADDTLGAYALSLRPSGADQYAALNGTQVTFSTAGVVTTLTWAGPALGRGDIVRVTYLYATVPNGTEGTIDNYVLTLPLADQRDETSQLYPLKNWNVRLIEADDPLFGVVVQNSHPFSDPVVWGKVRTEFPFSENAYNMEEYNGSVRDSRQPCDIGREFIDACRYGQSSKFNADVEIEHLSTHRIAEAQDIVREFVPFHAVLHALNVSGGVVDLLSPITETVEALVTMRGSENVLGGYGQFDFARARQRGLADDVLARNALAHATVVGQGAGVMANLAIVLYSNGVRFDRLGINPSSAVLEILSPAAQAGTYGVANPGANFIDVTGVGEPFSGAAFTFRLSHERYATASAKVTVFNRVEFSDAQVNFGGLGIRSQRDVDAGVVATAHTLSYAGQPYTVLDVLPDGAILVGDPGNVLANATNAAYSLKLAAAVVHSGTTGAFAVSPRSRVSVTESEPVSEFVTVGNYLKYNGAQYPVVKIESSGSFLVAGSTGASAGFVAVKVYKRFVDNATGNLYYRGTAMTTVVNEEISLAVQNGSNPPNPVVESDRFMENFLVEVHNAYYFIEDINGGVMTLGGPQNDWTIGGTSVNYTIHRYVRQPVTAQGQDYAALDRRGSETIGHVVQALPLAYKRLSRTAGHADEVVDAVHQTEQVSYRIEYRDEETQGE